MLNTAVYLLWQYGIDKFPEFLMNNFLVSFDSLAQGRYWTLLTSEFSHNMWWHFLLNMLVLVNFGNLLEQLLGAKLFLLFYLLAAIVSSLSHSLVSLYLLRAPDVPALGASGAISGLVLLFSLLFPRQKLLLMGIIPVPALIGAFIFVGLDLWGLIEQAEGSGLPIGHGAHLGGALAGALFFYLYLRPRLRYHLKYHPLS